MAVTAGNVHDSVAWGEVYNNVLKNVQNTEIVVIDSAYKTPWISKKIPDDGSIPIMSYTRFKGRKEGFRPLDYEYDAKNDYYICPRNEVLGHARGQLNGTSPMPKKNTPCVIHIIEGWPG